MAAVARLLVALLLVLLLVSAKATSSYPAPSDDHHGLARYSRIFGFGNSLTDTGNADIFPATAGGIDTRPPYGQTFFGHPSGRASDGRLLIDFIVEELKVPQPLPFLAGKTAADFAHGVNFALSGATALEPEFLRSMGLMAFVPFSLANETTWFEHVVQLINSSVPEQRKIRATSFFFVGEMGINDYFASLLSNRTVDQTKSLVPHVVDVIRSAITAMLAAGARTVMVSGMMPLGCEPYLLASFPGGPGDYDPATGCNTRLNDLAELHNRALEQKLLQLQVTHRGSSLIYADVYSPIASIVASPAAYDFGDKPLAACCGGGGGPYNFNFTTFCGVPGSTVCSDPSKSVFWDGIHFTEAANKFVARAVLASH